MKLFQCNFLKGVSTLPIVGQFWVVTLYSKITHLCLYLYANITFISQFN